MYWKENDFLKWTEHINSIVGADSTDGAFLAAEKTNGIEIMMAGEKKEVLELLASAVYNFSKSSGIAFDDAITEIKDTWDKLKQKEGYMQVGDEIIDIQTGIGINEKEGMISFPIPPKSVEDEMIAFISKAQAEMESVLSRLHSKNEIIELLNECTEIYEYDADNNEGGLAFVHNNCRYMYCPKQPGRICMVSDSGVMDEVFEEDEVFRDVVNILLDS